MSWPYYTKRMAHVAESIDTPASHEPWQRWINGVGGAGLVLAWAVRRLLAEIALVVPGHGGLWRQAGSEILLGTFLIGCGLLLHFHYFWSGHPRYFTLGMLGKAFSLLLIAGAVLGGVYRTLVLG